MKAEAIRRLLTDRGAAHPHTETDQNAVASPPVSALPIGSPYAGINSVSNRLPTCQLHETVAHQSATTLAEEPQLPCYPAHMTSTPQHILLRKAACALLPRTTFLTRRLRDGTIAGGPNKAGHGGRGVFIFGDDLEPELAALDQLLGRDGVLLDVGANSGVYTLKGARIVGPRGLVLSLEPNPEMLAVLHRNVKRNHYSNVRIRGLAAAEKCGVSAFYENKRTPNAFSLVQRGDSDEFTILTVNLDSLIEWEHIDRVDLIKIDAEGVEDRVLVGAQRLIRQHRPAIIAEFIRGGLTTLPDEYRAFQSTRTKSNNRLLLPLEHKLNASVTRAGWSLV